MEINLSLFDQLKELSRFTENAKKSLVLGLEQASFESEKKLNIEHMFVGILRNPKALATRILTKMGVDAGATLGALGGLTREMSSIGRKDVKIEEDMRHILVDAFLIASDLTHVYVGTEHIMLAILKQKGIDFVADLEVVGINYQTFFDTLQATATYHDGVFRELAFANNQIRRKPDEVEESAIEVFSYDMNELAKNDEYMPVYGRDEEVSRVIHILSRKTKSNPILVGEAGVGKTAIVEGLAQRLVKGDVPPTFSQKRIMNLDIAGILAGSKIRGDVEERILAIVDEASKDPNLVLFIDEIHMIVGAGSAGQGTMDIANILKPYLTSGQISIIGATTYAEYQRYFESDSALSRRFQPVMVDEISIEEAIKVLGNLKSKLENYHKVKITDEAVEQAVKLSDRYITDRFLPDKAIDLLDEASAGEKVKSKIHTPELIQLQNKLYAIENKKNEALAQNNIYEAAELRTQEMNMVEEINSKEKEQSTKGQKTPKVTGDEIRQVISRFTRIPVERMDTVLNRQLKQMDKVFGRSVIGQPDAIKKVTAAIKRSRVGIGDQNRPSASFLFLGPTGVGKSELAKTIAREVFGSDTQFVQIDMSEYMEPHSVSKLIGSPPGYVGFQDGGQLTEKIKRNPYSVVLFDEIEKAHPDTLNLLLQILEEGHLQDSKGRRVNFKNTIIIMTSNIGAEEVSEDNVLGFAIEQNTSKDGRDEIEKADMDKAFESMRDQLMQELKLTLRPELLNRIDEVIVFRGLNQKDMLEICKLETEKLNKRVLESNIILDVSRSVIEYIAKEGANKSFGARNIRRKVQEVIENPLAEFMLEHNLPSKTKVTIIGVAKGKKGIEFSIKSSSK